MSLFVLKLVEKQGTMTGAKFAQHLGLSGAQWSRIKSGKQDPTRNSIQLALALYPDLSYWLVEDSKAAHREKAAPAAARP